MHDVRHVAFLTQLFRFVQGRGGRGTAARTTLINSQETCLLSGLVTARQMGADYPFEDSEARKRFNLYGRVMYGWRFRSV